MVPDTHYTRSGDKRIAYQVVGDGPMDLVFVPGFVSNLELSWEEPSLAHFLFRLSSFSRLILFDKAGTGLSDRTANLPTLEERMDDVRAVMDAVGCEHAALFGISEGGAMQHALRRDFSGADEGARPVRHLRPFLLVGSAARKSSSPSSRASTGTGGPARA